MAVTITPKIDRTQNKYVFVAVHNVPDKVFESGSEITTISEPEERHGQPIPYQSFPRPSRFVYNTKARYYPIVKGNTVSTNLVHKLEHTQGVEHPQTDKNVYGDIVETY